MQGYWLYLASAALSAVSMTLHVHFALTIIFHLFCLRIILLKKNKLILFAIITYVIFFTFGSWSNHNHHETLFQNDNSQFTITFPNKPSIDGNKLSSIVSTDIGEKLALGYTIKNEAEKNLLNNLISSGTECEVTGVLSKPEQNRNENLFNYKQYLFRQNIHWKLKINSLTQCTNNKKGIITKINLLREASISKIDQRYPKEITPYAKALLFGDQNDFEDDTYSLYQRLGIVHLLAISGLHVTLLYMGIYYCLIRIGVTREVSSYLLLMFLPIYAILCGANPPVIRSVMMLMIINFASHSRYSFTSLDGLSISFLIFVFKDPFIIFNVGFQLSYIVSFAILLSNHTIISRYQSRLVQIVVISLISQISALSILAFQFYQISLISVFSNLLFVPLFSFVILPILVFSYISLFLFPWLFIVLNKLLTVIIFLSEKVAKLLDFKWSVLILGRPGIWILLLIFLSALYMFVYWEKGMKIYKSCFPLVLIICIVMVSRYFNPNGEIDFIDIGQGDSILILLPYHRGTYLIDTGGQIGFEEQEWMKRKHPYKIGEDVLIPLFKSKGISEIDKLILTHSDADHIGAAKELIGNINVKNVYISPNSWTKPLMYNTVKSFQKENTSILEVKNGYGWSNKSGSFQFVSPFNNHYEGNNDSLVLFAKVGGKSWLFTGDLEKEGEEELMKTYKLHADVLKVGHHGSKTSTSQPFLKALNPSIAVISVGQNNRYGHPTEEVLQRLKKEHAKIFRTDLEGEIKYTFIHGKGTFQTLIP